MTFRSVLRSFEHFLNSNTLNYFYFGTKKITFSQVMNSAEIKIRYPQQKKFKKFSISFFQLIFYETFYYLVFLKEFVHIGVCSCIRQSYVMLRHNTNIFGSAGSVSKRCFDSIKWSQTITCNIIFAIQECYNKYDKFLE